MSKKKVAILSASEVCYHARLVKAADYFISQGDEVHVFNPLVGFAPADVYARFVDSRSDWKFHEVDLRKGQGVRARWRWLVAGVLQKVYRVLWSSLKVKWGWRHIMTKGWIFQPSDVGQSFDVWVINLIDMLPHALRLKQRFGGIVIFDSQEFFTGQYQDAPKWQYEWVRQVEKAGIGKADIVLTTTDAMKHKLGSVYGTDLTMFRVRNIPTVSQQIIKSNEKLSDQTCHIVWHGMAVYFGNRRGVQVIMESLRYCNNDVHLHLQGNPVDTEMAKMRAAISDWGLENKVTFHNAAMPDEIVNSISKYDMGISGELAQEENQMLTSSNKLFEYINAGLAVAAPNVPGIKETIDELDIGMLYEPGNPEDLARVIDHCIDTGDLERFKRNSRNATEQGLNWEADYAHVYKLISDE